MISLFPKFDDKLKQLKHNTLVSFALFEILLFILVISLTIKGLIVSNILYITVFSLLIIPLVVIITARYKYYLIVYLFISFSYLSTVYFLFYINGESNAAISIFSIVLFAQSVLALLVLNWQTGVTLSVLSLVLLIIDLQLEKHGILNGYDAARTPSMEFLSIAIPYLFIVVIATLSYSITLNKIFNDYRNELQKRKEYEELLIEKNEAVNKMNVELEESLAQLEETNDQLAITLRRAEESDRLKSSFLQNISHEVRTPLNAIMGFLNLIKEDNKENNPNQNEFIDLTIESGKHLLQIISDIVELSELDAGLVKLNKTEVNLEDLIQEVYSNHLRDSEKKNLELILENNIKGQQALVYSDQAKITQIVRNLVSNGIKYTRSGKVQISCELDKDNIIINVIDTGIGIKPEKLKEIFDRFKQVEMDLSRSYGGLGIGLTIVEGFVKCMSGSIEVKSEYGKGSEFIVKLPYHPVGKILDETSSDRPHKKISKVLIAEDDVHNYLYLEKIIKKRKLNVLHAWNGKEAIELFKEHTDIQMVLMDIKMPVMDGLQAIQEIKKIRPDIQVVAITAYALDEEKTKFKSYGFDGYLTKPVTRESVLDLFN